MTAVLSPARTFDLDVPAPRRPFDPHREDVDTLAARDAQVSRCARCGEWRWRAAALPCQTCGTGPG